MGMGVLRIQIYENKTFFVIFPVKRVDFCSVKGFVLEKGLA